MPTYDGKPSKTDYERFLNDVPILTHERYRQWENIKCRRKARWGAWFRDNFLGEFNECYEQFLKEGEDA